MSDLPLPPSHPRSTSYPEMFGITVNESGLVTGLIRDIPESKPALAPIPGADDILQFFTYHHLPEYLQAVSKPFCELAVSIHDTIQRCPERTVALRKLLEAKDAAVRATTWKPTPKSDGGDTRL